MDYSEVYRFLMELDSLKSIYRNSYLADASRNENSAEHSWHLSMAILVFQKEVPEDIDVFKTIKMALIHDVCEIGAGDISVYDKKREEKHLEEKSYLLDLQNRYNLAIVDEIIELWDEYEEQKTPESKWVKVFDRLIPFCHNMATEGKSWQKQNVRKSQVVKINTPIKEQSSEMYAWVLDKIEYAVKMRWLKE